MALSGEALDPGQFREGSYPREYGIGRDLAIDPAIDGLVGEPHIVQGHLVFMFMMRVVSES
jgi:hypothetical protein